MIDLDLLANLILTFFIFSFGGWLFEGAISLFRDHEVVNRGFLNGPYCPIYGSGAMLFILLTHWTERPLELFFFGGLFACILEYFTSWLMEKIYKARWWDYNNWPLNINGRVCLYGFLTFGLFSSLMPFMKRGIDWFIGIIPGNHHITIAGIILIIFTIKNDAKRFYDSVVRQINRTNNYTITISTNLFIQNKAELSDLNSIYIVKNNKKEKVDYIDGLDIIFEGINNIIEIGGDPLPKFTNCVIKMKNNNHVKIDSSEYNINRLNLRIEGDNASLTIGKDFSIQSGMIFLDNNLEIKIGDDCMFSSNIYMRTSDGHTIIDNSTGEILNKPEKKSIVIGNHVWGGSGISILKNTKISDNSIIARAAVVTKKFESSNVVLVGSPAKIVKTNINWDRRTIEEYEKEVLCQKYQ